MIEGYLVLSCVMFAALVMASASAVKDWGWDDYFATTSLALLWPLTILALLGLLVLAIFKGQDAVAKLYNKMTGDDYYDL